MKGTKLNQRYFHIPDSLWKKIAPLLPKHVNHHRFGGGRPRVDDRKAMNGIYFVLRTGCQWNALNETGICSSSVAHSRFQEWRAAGVFGKLWVDALKEYDRKKHLRWKWLALDGEMNKAPLGGGKNRPQSHRQGEERRQTQRAV